MFKRFFPKQPKFFIMMSELSEHVHSATKILHEMMHKYENLAEYSTEMHILENKCDDLTHTIIKELNETFITPIDREDIYALTNSLDDIIDRMDSISTKLKIYKIKTPIAFGSQLAEILLSQTELLNGVVQVLQKPADVFTKLITIRNLETEGDTVFRESIAQLFDKESDIVELIKKKEILEDFEKAVDLCQRATIVIEGILIKNV
jgi:uncharacterized protein